MEVASLHHGQVQCMEEILPQLIDGFSPLFWGFQPSKIMQDFPQYLCWFYASHSISINEYKYGTIKKHTSSTPALSLGSTSCIFQPRLMVRGIDFKMSKVASHRPCCVQGQSSPKKRSPHVPPMLKCLKHRPNLGESWRILRYEGSESFQLYDMTLRVSWLKRLQINGPSFCSGMEPAPPVNICILGERK